MKKIHAILLIFSFIVGLTASCSESNKNDSEVAKVVDRRVNTAHDSTSKIVQNPLKDTKTEEGAPFLDITFIERLESSYGNSYEESILRKKGFNMYYNEESEDGRSTLYKSSSLRNSIRLQRHLWEDGAHEFSADYSVTEEQLHAFEVSLNGTLYHRQKDGSYKKKGLGSYVEKTIQLNPAKHSIIYWHYVGKEVSDIPPMPQSPAPLPPKMEDL